MRTTVVLLVLFLSSSALAQAGWFPLQEANTWSYAGDGGASWTQTVVGTTEIRGHPVFRLAHVLEPSPQDLENWWSEDEEGNVLLHGFDNSGTVREYDPPLVFVDAPLTLGKTWESSTVAYSSDGTSQPITLLFTVETEELLDLPVGSLPAFGLSYLDAPASRRDTDHEVLGLRGTIGKRGPGDVTEWFSLGVGLVQTRLGESLYRLTSYTIGSVAMRPSSFGAVKALYRR